MMIDVENVPLKAKNTDRREAVTAMFKLEPGQSFYTPMDYFRAHAAMNQSKKRGKRRLVGEFRVVPEGSGSRVGRVS